MVPHGLPDSLVAASTASDIPLLLRLDPSDVNGFVAILFTIGGALLLLAQRAFGRVPLLPFLDSGKHRSLAWAFIAWVFYWAALAVTYALRSVGWGREPMLMLSNGADIAKLMIVLILATGDGISTVRLKPIAVTSTVGCAMFYLAVLVSKSVLKLWFSDLGLEIILITPSIVLAGTSTLALAWVFMVRWGIQAFLLSLVLFAYASAQAPAYVAMFIHTGAMQLKPVQELQSVLWLLVVGKLLIGGYVFALFAGSRDSYPVMAHARFYPSRDEAILNPVDARVQAVGKWLIAYVLGGLLVAWITRVFHLS